MYTSQHTPFLGKHTWKLPIHCTICNNAAFMSMGLGGGTYAWQISSKSVRRGLNASKLRACNFLRNLSCDDICLLTSRPIGASMSLGFLTREIGNFYTNVAYSTSETGSATTSIISVETSGCCTVGSSLPPTHHYHPPHFIKRSAEMYCSEKRELQGFF